MGEVHTGEDDWRDLVKSAIDIIAVHTLLYGRESGASAFLSQLPDLIQSRAKTIASEDGFDLAAEISALLSE